MASAESAPKKAKVLTWQSKLLTAQDFKREGNELYKAEQHKAAIGKYHRAILYVKGIEGATQSLPFANMNPDYEAASKISDEGKAQVELLKIACYNNLAAALLQVDGSNLDKVVTYCEEVLAMDPNNVKALYRKGQALNGLRNFEDAMKVLRHATHQPEGEKDVRIRRLLQECSAQYDRQEEASRHTYRAMFSQMSIDDSVSNPSRLSSSDSDTQLDETRPS